MNGQQLTRRRMLGALAGALAILAGSATRSEAKDATKRPDYGSKGQFQLECELLGGTFSEDGLGNTECHFSDGSWIECDASGKDCWYTPAALPPGPINPWDQYPGTVVATTDVAETIDSDPTAPDNTGAAKRKRGRQGKKRGQRSKGRRR
jgi:hypothetical protein